MGGGMPNIEELAQRSQARSQKPAQEVLSQTTVHASMKASGFKVRQALASDTNPHPFPVSLSLDTTGSMGQVPRRLAQQDLLTLLQRLTDMGAVSGCNPQICFSGVADTDDEAPFQVGQFEADNRMDDWLAKLYIHGGAGPYSQHEAYTLVLYFLAYKTECAIWAEGGKGIAFIAGDERCPGVLRRTDVQRIFGDTIPQDLTVEALLKKVRERWDLYFLYTTTSHYGRETVEPIGKSLEDMFGKEAVVWLDSRATAVPEIVSSLVGISRGQFKREDVPEILRVVGVPRETIEATCRALKVPSGLDSEAPIQENTQAPKGRRGRIQKM